jgi:hypothetical protein
VIAYVDESGFPHPHDGNRNPVLTAVCISTDDVRNMMQKMYAIKMDIFGRSDVELKAVNVLRPKTLTHHSNNKLFAERVANEIISGRINLKVFSIIMEKPERPLITDAGTFPNHYRFLLQRVNGYAQSQGQKCIVCFDSQDEGNDMIISNKMKNYLFRSSEGSKVENIVESAFFVSSRVEEGIQLSDFCAGIVRKYHELCLGGAESTPFTSWLQGLYHKVYLQTCTVWSPGGEQQLFGFYKMPPRLLC